MEGMTEDQKKRWDYVQISSWRNCFHFPWTVKQDSRSATPVSTVQVTHVRLVNRRMTSAEHEKENYNHQKRQKPAAPAQVSTISSALSTLEQEQQPGSSRYRSPPALKDSQPLTSPQVSVQRPSSLCLVSTLPWWFGYFQHSLRLPPPC